MRRIVSGCVLAALCAASFSAHAVFFGYKVGSQSQGDCINGPWCSFFDTAGEADAWATDIVETGNACGVGIGSFSSVAGPYAESAPLFNTTSITASRDHGIGYINSGGFACNANYQYIHAIEFECGDPAYPYPYVEKYTGLGLGCHPTPPECPGGQYNSETGKCDLPEQECAAGGAVLAIAHLPSDGVSECVKRPGETVGCEYRANQDPNDGDWGRFAETEGFPDGTYVGTGWRTGELCGSTSDPVTDQPALEEDGKTACATGEHGGVTCVATDFPKNCGKFNGQLVCVEDANNPPPGTDCAQRGDSWLCSSSGPVPNVYKPKDAQGDAVEPDGIFHWPGGPTVSGWTMGTVNENTSNGGSPPVGSVNAPGSSGGNDDILQALDGIGEAVEGLGECEGCPNGSGLGSADTGLEDYDVTTGADNTSGLTLGEGWFPELPGQGGQCSLDFGTINVMGFNLAAGPYDLGNLCSEVRSLLSYIFAALTLVALAYIFWEMAAAPYS